MPKSPNYSEIEKLQKEAALESKKTDLKLQKLSDKLDRMAEINSAERKEIAKLQKEAALESKKTDLKLQKMAEINRAESDKTDLKLQKMSDKVDRMAESIQKLSESVQKTSDKVDRMAEINSAESKKTDLKLQKLSDKNAESKKTVLKLQKEAALESKKTELMIQKLSDKVDRMAEINSAESKKTELMAQKTFDKVDRMAEMYGGFSNNLGKETEEKFYQIFKAHPVLGKISFDEVHKNIYMPPNLEIDILLSNGTALGICEVKRRLKKTDIEKFFEKTLPKFIKFNNPYYNKLNYYVVFACETMASDVLDETKKHDCFLISSDFKKDKFVIHQSSQH